MLKALAEREEGMSTAELRALCGGTAQACFSLLKIQAGYGRVARVGTVVTPSGRKAQVWRITGEGRQFLEGGARDGDAPMTELCLCTLGLLGGEASTTEVRKGLEADGIKLTPAQVRTSLWALAYAEPPRAQLTEPGRAGYSTAGIWRLTDCGWTAFLSQIEESAR